MVKKKRSPEEFAAVEEPMIVEESASVSSLRTSLEEVKTYDGVVGYILRNSTSAAIDLKDPAKIIDYAILSSSLLEAGKQLSEVFNLGDTKSAVVEGKNIKVLSLALDENKVSVFMEKNADCEKVLRRLR